MEQKWNPQNIRLTPACFTSHESFQPTQIFEPPLPNVNLTVDRSNFLQTLLITSLEHGSPRALSS